MTAVPDGGWWLAIARAGAVATLLSLFGTLLFRAVIVPRAVRDAGEAVVAERHLIAIARASAAAFLIMAIAWLLLQAADLSALVAVPTVLARTWFGHLMLLQLAAVAGLLTLLLAWPSRPVSAGVLAGCAAVALLLQAGHSHAMAMQPGFHPLLVSDALHLLAAGAWLGGLIPLLAMAACLPARTAAAAARWFSPLGKLCVGLIAVTASYQGVVMIASVPGLLGTDYGRVALCKMALLGVLLAFAILNRYRLAPALLRTSPERARRRLIGALAVQTGFGLLTVMAASTLGQLPPAMHVQPAWPFPLRPSLDTIDEDPAFRNEVIGAALALAGAVLAVAAAWLLRRRIGRAAWLAAAAAAAVAWLAVPHLDLLLVEAYPTSYYRTPTGFAAATIVEGAALFPAHCAGCHGADGTGHGPAAAGLPVPPADLTAAHLWMHADGELFWWLTHGIEAPGRGVAMPGFAGILSEDQRWALIDYIRAHNAGLVERATGTWTPPLPAPAFTADCADRSTVDLAALRGRYVRLVFGTSATGVTGVTTILAGANLPAPPPDGPCTARDPDLVAAYAIVSATAPEAMTGRQFLIDDAGWLRAVQPPGAEPGWNDPGKLLAEVRRLRENPVAASDGTAHARMQM